MLQERLKMRVIELCHGLYQNLWYLVNKSTPGKYRLVNIAVQLHQITIQDANLPLSTHEFFEEFAGCTISFFIDFFSGYDQVKLAEKFRDLTIFITTLGLMQMITLAQGATNLVAQFVKIVLKILAPHLRNQAKLFLNDVRVKRPKTTYKNEELTLEIRGYVVEHI